MSAHAYGSGVGGRTRGEPAAAPASNGVSDLRAATRVFLQPIAPPSILGLMGFAVATFMVSTNLAHWYGNPKTPLYLFPFAAMFGGVAQFAAALFAYKARDGLATGIHGAWGSFWMAYGILFLLNAVGVITIPTGKFPALGFWFIGLAGVTLTGALAALFESLGLVAVLSTLTAGSACLAVGYLTGIEGWLIAGGWVLFASAICAWYTASAMMLESAAGRVILPLGKYRVAANKPGSVFTLPVGFEAGEPGIRHGQ